MDWKIPPLSSGQSQFEITPHHIQSSYLLSSILLLNQGDAIRNLAWDVYSRLIQYGKVDDIHLSPIGWAWWLASHIPTPTPAGSQDRYDFEEMYDISSRNMIVLQSPAWERIWIKIFVKSDGSVLTIWKIDHQQWGKYIPLTDSDIRILEEFLKDNPIK